MLHIAYGDSGARDNCDDGMALGAPIAGHGCEGNGADNTMILGSIVRIGPGGSDAVPSHLLLSSGDCGWRHGGRSSVAMPRATR